MKTGIIIAGGKGTRMGNINIPKAMLVIGDKPLLGHQIDLLWKYGFSNIIILTHHLSERIEQYCDIKMESNPNLTIKIHKEKEPLGTAGALRDIKEMLPEEFLMLYGDKMVNINLKRMMDFHREKNSDCTIALHPTNHMHDSDLVEIDENKRIIKINSKPHKEGEYYRNLANIGLCLMSSSILEYVDKGKMSDFGKDIFSRIVDKKKMYGYPTAEYSKDAGTPERLKEINQDYALGNITSYDTKRRAVFLDRDGIINEIGNFCKKSSKALECPCGTEDFKLMPRVAESVKKINDSNYLAIVITNQPNVAKNFLTIDGLNKIHNKMETLLNEKGAKLDAIYYCPHHPEKGHPDENPLYKFDCDCRKPKTGMIDQAVKEFNIDIKNSIIIGDANRDILCGKNAGLKTIGIRKGEGCKDCNPADIDYIFDNLYDAVTFLLEEPYQDIFTSINKTYENVLKNHISNKPFVVSVGGNCHSGKTSFSKYICERFRKDGKKTLLIDVDNWILPIKRRKKCKNVFARYQIGILGEDLKNLIKGTMKNPWHRKHHVIEVDGYNYAGDSNPKKKVTYKYTDEDVVFIVGNVVLHSQEIRLLSHLKVYCSINEKNHFKRFSELYSWRGLDKIQIKVLYESRKKDEIPLIEEGKQYADIILKTGAGGKR